MRNLPWYVKALALILLVAELKRFPVLLTGSIIILVAWTVALLFRSYIMPRIRAQAKRLRL